MNCAGSIETLGTNNNNYHTEYDHYVKKNNSNYINW